MREFFNKANSFIEKYMMMIMPVCVVVGFLLGDRISFMRSLNSWLFGFACFAGSLTLPVSEFRKALNLKAVITLLILGHVVLPLVASLLFRLAVDPSSDYFIGLMLVFAGPCATTSCIWSGIFGGNKGLSVLFVVIDTVLCMFLTPFIVRLTCSTAVEMNMTALVISMIKMVLIPSLLGIAVSSLVKREKISVVSPYIRFITKTSLLLIITVSISGSQEAIRSGFSFGFIWSFLLIAIIVVAGYAMGYLANRYILRSELADGISLAFGLGCRNLGLSIILANSYFPPLAAVAPVVALFYHDIITAGAGRFFLKLSEKDKAKKGSVYATSCNSQVQ